MIYDTVRASVDLSKWIFNRTEGNNSIILPLHAVYNNQYVNICSVVRVAFPRPGGNISSPWCPNSGQTTRNHNETDSRDQNKTINSPGPQGHPENTPPHAHCWPNLYCKHLNVTCHKAHSKASGDTDFIHVQWYNAGDCLAILDKPFWTCCSPKNLIDRDVLSTKISQIKWKQNKTQQMLWFENEISYDNKFVLKNSLIGAQNVAVVEFGLWFVF